MEDSCVGALSLTLFCKENKLLIGIMVEKPLQLARKIKSGPPFLIPIAAGLVDHLRNKNKKSRVYEIT
jgi:hypothetical protein